MTRGRRIAITVAVLVAIVIGLRVLDDATRPPGGHSSSSYATAPDGAAGYAELLQEHGHTVERLRASLASTRLDAGSTLIVLDPGALDDRAVDALRSFAERGGQLVAGGLEEPALDRLVGSPVTLDGTSADGATPLVPLDGVERVSATGDRSFSATGTALPVLARGDAILAAVATLGRGHVALLADTSPLTNELLASDDDAALGLALAGPPGRPVLFAESVHGYGRATGLSALPTGWRVALAGLLVAALALMLARGRRLGPPERADRELAPARREHVDAVAATLRKTRRPDEAAEPLRAAVRARLGDHDAAVAIGKAVGEQGLIDAAVALARLESAGATGEPGKRSS
ncbi:MAG: DUF4350 domain-containing protein [Gaiellales bacterium]